MKKLSLILVFIILISQTLLANMYHIKVLSDKVPDLSNIEIFGSNIGDNWESNNEKAIILSYWIEQLTTYGSPLYYSRQWNDPIAFINNNEFGMCSDLTLLMNAMGEGAFGFTGRRHELSGLNVPILHTVPEIEYDGALHLFDPSFGFAYGHYDNGIVTSMEDYALNPYYSRNNTPSALTRDSDGEGFIKAWLSADLFGWSIDRFRYDEYSPELSWIENRTEGYYGVHRFDISIEDYEYYTRYWSHLDGLAGFSTRDFFWPHYNYNDVDDYSWNDNDKYKAEHRGNGLWVYEPDLTDALSFESSQKVTLTTDMIYPTALDIEGSVVFKIDAANFVTGVLIEAKIKRAQAEDSVIIEASSSGGNFWFPVWENKAIGDIEVKENISDMIKGTLKSQDLRHVTDFLVRVRLNTKSNLTAATLKSMKISTVTMLGKSSLPKLMLGENEITVAKANNHTTYQTKTFNPILTRLENGINDEIYWEDIQAWKLYVKDYKNLEAYENYGNLYNVLEKNHWEKGWVTYELDAPRDIKKARLGGSFIVKNNSKDMFKIKYRVHNGSWSGWSEVAAYDFSTRNNSDKRENQSQLETWNIEEENVRKIQFKIEVFHYAHIEALHMEIDYEAKSTPSKPLYITYNWTEYYENGDGHLPQSADGGITRTFSQKVGELPYKFSINTGGDIQPRMNSISMHLEGNKDPKNYAPIGYSDGIDKGSEDFIPMINYDIGDIVSIGKPILLSHSPYFGTKEQLVDGRIIAGSKGERGNAGGGKVEEQNDEDDIVKFSQGVGMLELVVDLGEVQSIGGVRIDSYKDSWSAYFPESISVESATNGNFTHIATDVYKSAKYAYNLYPVAWTLPPDATSRHLGRFPNYGLLSNYTFIPFDTPVTARYIKIKIKEQNHNGSPKGITLSEVHIYDKLTANNWSPKLKHAKPVVVVEPSLVTVQLEAEEGELSSPMVSQNSAGAFGGKYILGEYGSGSASYTFTIQSAGNYKIWGRFIAPDGESDSFFVKMDEGGEDIWDMHPNSNIWNWNRVNGRDYGGVKSYYLTAGTHTLVIRARESGAKLDKIIITNDDNFIPSNPPLVDEILEIEAEDAMLSNPMSIKSDAQASGSKYITKDYGEGSAIFTFNVTRAGSYKLRARYIASDGLSDSFFVKMDNEAEDIWDMHPNTDSWNSTNVSGRELGSEFIYDLSSGEHVFTIRGRENGARLDKLTLIAN